MNVGGGGNLPAQKLLRRGIAGCPDAHGAAIDHGDGAARMEGGRFGTLEEAEVDQDGRAIAGKDVGGFDVAMNESPRMECARPAADGADEPRHGGVRRRQIEGLEKLRRVPQAVLVLSALEEGGEGRVTEFGQHLRLALEACPRGGVGPVENLQRGSALAVHFHGAVDLARAAARDKGDDAPPPDLGAVGKRRPALNGLMPP